MVSCEGFTCHVIRQRVVRENELGPGTSMSLHCSVVCIRGNHLSRMTDLLSLLDYRLVGSPVSCATSKALEAALDEPTHNRDIVRKAAYESNGWTYLFDPEMMVMMSDKELSDFARENSTDIFTWVCEGISASYGFRVFNPELRRDLLAVGGSVKTDVGTRLPEEQGLDWGQADETDILSFATRLGAPYDYFSTDRSYVVYTLDESHMPVPDAAGVNLTEQPFRPEDIVARVVGRVPIEKKPWWKFW